MRDPDELRVAFARLGRAAEPGTFVGHACADEIICARDEIGNYDLFVPVIDSAVYEPLSTRIGSVYLYSPRIYAVDVGSERRVGPYLRVSLGGERSDLLEAFLATFCACLPESLPLTDARALVRHLTEVLWLLQGDQAPTPSEIKGLWAELWLIHSASNPGALVAGWHSRARDKIDFSVGGMALEVKCHEGRERLHRLRLDQLELSPDTTYLVSVCVASSPTGYTILDLVGRIGYRLSDSDRALVARQVVSVVGADVGVASEFKFEVWPDLPPVAVPARVVPRPRVEDPQVVKDVEFVVDISNAARADGIALAALLD